MEHRHDQEMNVFVSQAVGLDGQPIIKQQIAVTHYRPFSPTGRPGCVHDDGKALGADVRVIIEFRALCDQRLERRSCRLRKADGNDGLDARAFVDNGFDLLPLPTMDNEQLGIGIINEMAQFVAAEMGIDRHQNTTAFDDGPVCQDEFNAVRSNSVSTLSPFLNLARSPKAPRRRLLNDSHAA